MWPQVVQFETKQMELEAQLRLYGEREVAGQRALAGVRRAARSPSDGIGRRLLALGTRGRRPAAIRGGSDLGMVSCDR